MISAQWRKSLFSLFPNKTASISILSVSHLSTPLPLNFLFSTDAKPPPYENASDKNCHSIALFLKENGFSDTQLEKVMKVKQRQLSNASLEKSIKPKLDVFRDFGFSNAQIAKIITRDPTILCYSASRRVYPSLRFLWDLFGDINRVAKVVVKTGWFFSTDVKKNLLPNIELLKSHGLSMERILLLLSFFPRTLLTTTERLKRGVDKVEGLGVDASSKMYIYCLWAAVSMSTEVWDSKIQTFMSLGFTKDDILKTFTSIPIVFTVSAAKIKRIVEAILATDRYTISSITTHPSVLCFSLEKRLKPRLRILQILEAEKLIKKWPNLTAVYAYTDHRFHGCFIGPYPKLFSGINPPSSRRKKEISQKNP